MIATNHRYWMDQSLPHPRVTTLFAGLRNLLCGMVSQSYWKSLYRHDALFPGYYTQIYSAGERDDLSQ